MIPLDVEYDGDCGAWRKTLLEKVENGICLLFAKHVPRHHSPDLPRCVGSQLKSGASWGYVLG